MEIKISLVIQGLDINLRFFLEARLGGAYLLRQLLEANTKLSNINLFGQKRQVHLCLKMLQSSLVSTF